MTDRWLPPLNYQERTISVGHQDALQQELAWKVKELSPGEMNQEIINGTIYCYFIMIVVPLTLNHGNRLQFMILRFQVIYGKILGKLIEATKCRLEKLAQSLPNIPFFRYWIKWTFILKDEAIKEKNKIK